MQKKKLKILLSKENIINVLLSDFLEKSSEIQILTLKLINNLCTLNRSCKYLCNNQNFGLVLINWPISHFDDFKIIHLILCISQKLVCNSQSSKIKFQSSGGLNLLILILSKFSEDSDFLYLTVCVINSLVVEIPKLINETSDDEDTDVCEFDFNKID